jgi:hypothetical protein
VETALLHVRRRDQALLSRRDVAAWEEIVRVSFHRSGAPDIRSALKPYFTRRQLAVLARMHGFDHGARISTLSFGQWLALFRFHAHACRGPTLLVTRS